MRTKLLSLLSCLIIVTLSSCGSAPKDKYCDSNFTTIFNGENLDGWYLKIRSGNDSLAKKIFAVEDGMIHVFNDEFPNPYNLGEIDTHGLMYTNKEYSKFILRFDYKWGETIANNYDKYQYDAGCYYHVVDDQIWPVGIEYQIRYNDVKNQNHTGDFYIDSLASEFTRYTDGKTRYLAKEDGGVLTPRPTKAPKLLRAAGKVTVNNLNGEWNECEIIVMDDKYAIHKLNGEIVNMGENLYFSSGVIGLQSETAEVYYRNIRILEFDEVLPIEEFLN